MNTPARQCRRLLAGAAVAALILSACGDDDDSADSATAEPTAEAPAATTAAPASTVPAEATGGSATAGGDVPEGGMTELGEGEGEVKPIAWAGYVEDGSTDPAVDWVTGFENDTGCQVNVTLGNTSDEMVSLMQTGEYD